MKISGKSIIIGHSGISINSGTQIYPNSTLACSCLGFNDCFSSNPLGSISLGKNCIIHTNCIIATYGGIISLSEDVSVNPYTVIYGHGNISVGKMTRIAAHCTLISANHIFEKIDIPIMKQGLSMKGITIGDNVWIGTRSVILDGAIIGEGAVIGAGTVVTKNILPYSVVAGVPAKLIRYRTK